MRILFDQGVPAPLRDSLRNHEISTAYECGWSTLNNGDLLDAADGARFDILITTDKNLRHQQNLAGRRIAIVVLPSASWPRIQRDLSMIGRAVEQASEGSYMEG